MPKVKNFFDTLNEELSELVGVKELIRFGIYRSHQAAHNAREDGSGPKFFRLPGRGIVYTRPRRYTEQSASYSGSIYALPIHICDLRTVSGMIGITGSHSHSCVRPTSKMDHEVGQYHGSAAIICLARGVANRSTEAAGRTANRWSQSGRGVGYIMGGAESVFSRR